MKVDYRVSEVTRYVVTRAHTDEATGIAGCTTIGEFRSQDDANEVVRALGSAPVVEACAHEWGGLHGQFCTKCGADSGSLSCAVERQLPEMPCVECGKMVEPPFKPQPQDRVICGECIERLRERHEP